MCSSIWFYFQNSQIHAETHLVKTAAFVSLLAMDTRADVDLNLAALIVNIVNVSLTKR